MHPGAQPGPGLLAGLGGGLTELYRSTTPLSNAPSVTDYTFSSASIGPARADRYVFALISGRSGSSGRTISSVTIGGVSATIHRQDTASSGGSSVTGIAMAAVPSGTTADVDVSFSGAMSHCMLDIISLGGLASATPDATGGATSTSSGTTISHTQSYLAGAYVMSVGMQPAATSATWSHLTESSDGNTVGDSLTSNHTTGYLLSESAGSSETIQITWADSNNRKAMSTVAML